ncbi:M23 family metallopeptidase [Aureivirga sp. CE67]|uniref:M23 family metallopeptidase n=1 Tax=Aureivirga sp. CE67 TaxID=1788983 RepID=UPI0018CA295A|nr:M23 family metallopeptidase [Aureivirga sp. CE67]
MEENQTPKKEKSFKNKLTSKYRMVILNDDNFEEKLSLKLTRLNVFIFGSIFSILLVVGTIFLIAFTPLREYIPGYTSTDYKRKTSALISKLDSLERQTFITNQKIKKLLPILRGEEVIEEFYNDSDIAENISDSPKSVNASKIDSIFREEVEREKRFNLFDEAKKNIGIVFFTPITGTISQQYDPENKHYAIDVAVAEGTPVKAAAEGTVIFAEWTAQTGNVVIIEHANGFISVYKHNASLLKEQGDLVKSGEVIATAGSTGDLSSGPHLHFELWNEGYPVNPTNFIDFE